MNKTEESQASAEESASELLDQVMRGERQIWLPPGSLVAIFFIPCLCAAAVPLGFLLTAPILPINAPDKSLATALWPMGLALALVLLAIVGFAQIVWGYSFFMRWLQWYIRALFLVAAVLSMMAMLGWIYAPIAICIWALVALVICHLIINSWSVTAVTAFFAIKRRYRQEARQKALKILAD